VHPESDDVVRGGQSRQVRNGRGHADTRSYTGDPIGNLLGQRQGTAALLTAH
jgi:hypothetical protein